MEELEKAEVIPELRTDEVCGPSAGLHSFCQQHEWHCCLCQ